MDLYHTMPECTEIGRGSGRCRGMRRKRGGERGRVGVGERERGGREAGHQRGAQ